MFIALPAHKCSQHISQSCTMGSWCYSTTAEDQLSVAVAQWSNDINNVLFRLSSCEFKKKSNCNLYHQMFALTRQLSRHTCPRRGQDQDWMVATCKTKDQDKYIKNRVSRRLETKIWINYITDFCMRSESIVKNTVHGPWTRVVCSGYAVMAVLKKTLHDNAFSNTAREHGPWTWVVRIGLKCPPIGKYPYATENRGRRTRRMQSTSIVAEVLKVGWCIICPAIKAQNDWHDAGRPSCC